MRVRPCLIPLSLSRIETLDQPGDQTVQLGLVRFLRHPFAKLTDQLFGTDFHILCPRRLFRDSCIYKQTRCGGIASTRRVSAVMKTAGMPEARAGGQRS